MCSAAAFRVVRCRDISHVMIEFRRGVSLHKSATDRGDGDSCLKCRCSNSNNARFRGDTA